MTAPLYPWAYFDTSALVKKYVVEPGSETLLKIYKNTETLTTSILTYAEMHSAFSRLYRFQEISQKHWETLLEEFEKDWENFNLIPCSQDLFQEISQIFQKFPLRGIDGVHLASAASLAKHNLNFPFVCCDQRLNNAASDYGFKVINPELSST